MIRYNAKLDVERAGDTSDAGGSPLPDAWTARLKNVPCFLYPVSSRVAEEFGRRRQLAVTHQAMTTVDLKLLDGNTDERVSIAGVKYTVAGYVPYEGGPATGANLYVATLVRRNQN